MQNSEMMEKRKRLWRLMDREQNIDIDSLTKAFAHHLEYTICKYRENIQGADIFRALAYTVRD
ncbi:MAG: hypothetical protein KDK30_12615, partial [Leptospiraceae bacterium]|nr:hypothetical protein [Leptospiraceae bacterium]